jgi:DNA polymerase-3 subunit gamma/tau
MSYQVLARKWRPRLFREMVGQTHVLQALINALDHDRLHHAYLFTGTRGVGKTSIARILAKCLNCETGVSSEPCGTCSACREIDEGRFVDLIEVDAASRTKVEDTRELLDNVQYAPSRGRYKVYLIDEVHMLSSHSFNALLKTLEEPPEHVKFLLATTDPQKLPVTILSRCLQFSLKNMLPEKIVDHLRHVLGEEMIRFDEESLWLLGRAADGSMRDALSLTDQAIAFGNGALQVSEVRSMLGTIDHGQVFGLLEALAANDAQAMLAAVAELAEQGADFTGVLGELLSVLQRVAIAQILPQSVDNSLGDQEQVLGLAGRVSAEDVQLFYQMGLHGRRDLPLAPEPRGGFEMAMLRMLAFRPGTLEQDAVTGSPGIAPGKQTGLSQAKAESESARPEATAQAAPAVVLPVISEPEQPSTPESESVNAPVCSTSDNVTNSKHRSLTAGQPLKATTPVKPPQNEPPAEWLQAIPADPVEDERDAEDDEGFDVEHYSGDWQSADAVAAATSPRDAGPEDETSATPVDMPAATGLAAEWLDTFLRLKLSGLTQSIAAHCQLVGCSGDTWTLHLDPGHSALYNDNHRLRLQQALIEHIGSPVDLEVLIASPDQETPAIAAALRKHKRQQEAEVSIQQDPLVLGLMRDFAAQICEGTIRPIDTTTH